MLKALLVLALMAFARQDAPKQNMPGHPISNNKPQNTQTVIGPALPVVNLVPSAPPIQPQALSPANQLHWFLKPEWMIVWVTILYTIVTVFYTVTAWLTLKAIQRQAVIMKQQGEDATASAASATLIAKQSADAALLYAKALAHSERPWIIIQITENPAVNPAMTRFQFHAFNHGNSPAYVTSCSELKTVWLENPDLELPPIPQYGTQEWDKCLLLPKHKMPIGEQIDPWGETVMAKTSRPPKMQLVIYGIVEYTDGVTDHIHQTAFCYRRKRDKFSDMGGHMFLCGPNVYNKHT